MMLPSEVTFNELKALAEEGSTAFKEDKSNHGQKLFLIYVTLSNTLDQVRLTAESLSKSAALYDYPGVPANGFRSYLQVLNVILVKTITLSREILARKSSYFFRKAMYSRELNSYAQVIASVHKILTYLETLMSWTEEGELFPREFHSPKELISENNFFVNQYCFYGRCLGFQYCDSLAPVLKALATLMASFSEVYYGGRVIDSLWHGSKYFINPELRAKRVVNISQYASADFCKTFWFLGEMELMTRLPSFVCASLVVNRVITIQPETVLITGVKGSLVEIPPAASSKGPSPLNVRLMSSTMRCGMVSDEKDSGTREGLKEASSCLLFHCHGGGFVAQSSRSHETYLRQWALGIDCPILSIDYSLAPECPFPRALDEAFYAYCWALANASQLGFTGERIILAGDSAGANLNIGVTTKCIQLGVRPPDGVFLAYAPVVVSSLPSPSRLLCLMDPLLPFGFLLNCCKAYAASPEVYATSTLHEYKLRKNISRPTFEESVDPAKPAQMTKNNSEDDLVELDDSEDSRPVLMSDTKENDSLISKLTNSLSSKLPSFPALKSQPGTPEECRMEKEMLNEALLPCPLDMMDFEVPHDPLISPYYLSDDVLQRFPPVTLLSLHLDPFLDDCVEFAKKLKNNGNRVHLEVLGGLSHGFLNFSMLSSEAHEASKRCLELILQLINNVPSSSNGPIF